MATDKELIDSLKMDWLPSDYYNYEDLNRVEQATQIVRDKILSFRQVLVALDSITTNRTQSSIEFSESFNRIETNISRLKETFSDKADLQISKTNWIYNAPFDYSDANRLEKDLYDMFYIIENNTLTVPYCGQYTAGQEGVI